MIPGFGRILLFLKGDSLIEYSRQKLLFMHIAKTAGSSVNNFFARHYAQNQYALHIESNKGLQSNPVELEKLNFLSGHISLFDLNAMLDLDEYYKVTVVREPYAHLRSHLSWINRLALPGEEQRFRQHEAYIQAFARKLSRVNFSCPDELKTLVESLEDRERQLVDNCQVRYFTRVPAGQPVCDADAHEAIRASAAFDQIGTAESLGEFLKKVADEMLWPEPEYLVRENVNQGFYGLDLSNKYTRAALEPLVKHDLTLYESL